jgi:large subunit ribosomal protein L15
MDLAHLQHAKGATKKTKRVGRGPGSGHGKTSCRGHKGEMARSGSKRRAWSEGGQMPLQRRIPKRGFHSLFKRSYQVVNVGDLNRIEGDKANPDLLFQAGLIGDCEAPLKILGEGEFQKAMEVNAHAFSKSAVQKIEAAGGKVIRI